MAENKQQLKYAPVRVRFRSPVEQAPGGQEQATSESGNGQHWQAEGNSITQTPDALRGTRQIKELLRLGNLLRADLGLDEVLHQIAASMASCTGFRIVVVNLIDEQENLMKSVAFAGIPEEHERILREKHDQFDTLGKAMLPEFRISQSYFVSHEHQE